MFGLGSFGTWMCRKGEIPKYTINQTATMSADEPSTNKLHQSNHLPSLLRTDKTTIIKHDSMWLQYGHRWVFPNHQWLLVKPNRMFGLGSFGTWMCRKSRCVIKAIYYLEQKTIRCQFLCLLSFLIKESRVADMAKPMLIMIKLHRRAQTSWKPKQTHQSKCSALPHRAYGTRING